MPKTAPVPAYRLHKASGQARVIIRGKQIYLGKYNSPESLEKYGWLVAAWKGGVAPAPPEARKPEDQLLIVELCNEYRKWAERYYVKGGEVTGQIDLVKGAIKSLTTLYGTLQANEFGALKLAAIQEHLIGAKLSRGYINQRIGIIKRIFKWGATKELVSESVFGALWTVPGLKRGRTEAREAKPVLPVDDATIDATLPYLPPVVADMVRLQRLIGCRPGEVCGIRPCDVDTGAEVWTYTPESHKTEHHGRERKIFIGPRGQDVLRPYLLRQKDAFCFSPVESERKRHAEMREARKSKVQPSQMNRSKSRAKRKPTDRYTKESYCRAVARGAKLADQAAHKANPDVPKETRIVPHWHPNQLRHSVATAIRRQFGLEAAQTVLGHSKADVTQVYAERDWSKAAAVMREVG